MVKVVAKLNLNKTPQAVEDNSLVMAKNIRLLKDGSIAPDTSLDVVEIGQVTNQPRSTIDPTSIQVTRTTKYYISIHLPVFYDIRNIIDSYLQISSIEYKNFKYVPNVSTISITNPWFDIVTSEIVYNTEYTFIAKENSLVYSGDTTKSLLYLINEDAYIGDSTFEILSNSRIEPYYYAIGTLNSVNSIVEYNHQRYIVVNPVDLYTTISVERTGDPEYIDSYQYIPVRYIGQIVGLNNKIYFFKEATERQFLLAGLPYPENPNDRVRIFVYNELSNEFEILRCGWRYSGGEIDGQVTTNNTDEEILTICEYNVGTDVKVPIKHINIQHCKEEDDESIYTQTPNIPFTNLNFLEYYNNIIPNGVYQFFIRYKVRDDFYSDWFPCSEELYAYQSVTTNTIQGVLRHIDKHRDCPRSFKFEVKHIFNGENSTDNYTRNFEEYQLGFILSSGDSVVARSWKSFTFDVNTIYFDYDKNSIQEINIDDVLKTSYELFNVENLTYYKNKLFISNYEETNFNPDLEQYANNINIGKVVETIDLSQQEVTIFGAPVEKTNDEYDYYDKWNGGDVKYLFDKLLEEKKTFETESSTYKDYYNDDNKYVLKIHMYWKNAKEINVSPNHHERNAYWLKKQEVGLNFKLNDRNNNDTIRELKFNTYDYDSDEPASANLVNSEWIRNNVSRWESNGNHEGLKSLEDGGYGNRIKHNWFYPLGKAGERLTHFWRTDVNWIPGVINYKQRIVYRTDDYTFHRSVPEKFWSDDILQCVKKDKYPKAVICNLSVIENGNSTPIVLIQPNSTNNDIFTDNNKTVNGDYNTVFLGHTEGNDSTSYTDEDFKQKVFNEIREKIIGVKVYNSGSAAFIIDYNGQNKEIVNISFTYLTFDYSTKIEPGTESNSEVTRYLYVKADCYEKTFSYNCSINSEYISQDYPNHEYKTLMPFTNYEFYIHYVKQNGVHTNGFYIGNLIHNSYTDDEDEIQLIYPTFSNIQIPTGYVGYFISIIKVENNVMKLFNVRRYESDNTEGKDEDYVYADCLESDANIYPLSKNIYVYKYVEGTSAPVLVSSKGEYFSSGNNNPISQFGTCGEIRWKDEEETPIVDGTYWIIIKNDASNNKNKELIKLTPYSTTPILICGKGSNLPAFICCIGKLSHASDTIYVSGTDIYDKDVDSTGSDISLEEKLVNVAITYNNFYYVPSNFNLNCVSLSEDITSQTRTYYANPNDENDASRQFISAVNSLTSSSILTLETMYYDYVRKVYSVYNDKQKYIFNNTIRSSDVNTDEAYRNIYKFESEDYYNVPVNRGKITKIFNLVNYIYVHTEHSLFKFTGNNNLTATEGEVSLKEGDVFDSGIQELFDSKNGYAGLSKKDQALVMFDSYVFWDEYVQQIYAFAGEGRIVPISDSISKIIKEFKPTDVKFVGDEVNDRFFVKFENNNDVICLSYNFKANSFISVHDIDFISGFNSRLNTYFIHIDTNNGVEIGWSIYRIKDYITIGTKNYFAAYRNCWKASYIKISDIVYSTRPYLGVCDCCIDVIHNTNYELIKNLDYINWICSEIREYDFDNLLVAEENLNRKYSGNKLRIYSDSCETDLVNLVDQNGIALESNNQSLDSRNSWQYPRYNCGVWSLNYFRNNNNKDDVFGYKDASHGITAYLTPHTQRLDLTQESSLIYGKYFVFRLIFTNRNFKFENITFKVNNYDKVKQA